MARWKPLPEGLDPLVIRLIVELRRMKDVSGLSLAQLAVRTGRSASSWERYLDGRAVAPRQAVQALTRLAGADQAGVMVLCRSAQDTAPLSMVRLADALKELRRRTGLSLAALATKTQYSKSSWARWLAGEGLPPWHATAALCALAGEPDAYVRALWTLADDEWSRRGVVAAPRRSPAASTSPIPPSPRA